ncbi:MAG TPA: asparagine synthase (glutamine-hydrolyzing) [Longimicrobiales bacterium]|nr:asparagine synthase (glutamine-hydrolyzing) [Longimicrobiales bacterium]
MCGICGRLDFRGAPVARERIAAMCATLVHRGPDDEGIHVAPGIGLGQRRLSIIDLSAGAAPPLSNEDGTVWVVLNGEIYNFRELREGLRARGHVFRTASDTEVLVHLYEEHGTAMLGRLAGMFAFAIWDAARGRLFAARDRLGKKPFYFARSASALVFASELKAILADPDVVAEPDYVALDQYLTYQYVPSPRTAFAGIAKLPPGHFLVCGRDGAVAVERYWAPPEIRPDARSPDELAEETVHRLREAVRRRLVADVPLGAFLSGGIDSASVVALMAAEVGAPVKTFSIGFTEETHDELPFARLVAERYGTEHHELVVEPDMLDVLPRIVQACDEPFADSSAVPTFYLSQLTRRHVTVALSGDGGDETFGGYRAYRDVGRWATADRLPALARRSVSRSAAGVLELLPYSPRVARGSRAAAMLGGTLRERYLLHMSLVKPQERRVLYADAFRARLAAAPPAPAAAVPWSPGEDAYAWMMRHDLQFYLPDCLMVKTDRASMANSLEVRCPFLDHELVEFAAAVPGALKVSGSTGKLLLRRAVGHLLPEPVLRRPKMGFGLPLGAWLRADGGEFLRGVLLDERAERRGLLRPAAVSRMVADHVAGGRDMSGRLWALIMLELWHREYID